jgi:hypothetical protein
MAGNKGAVAIRMDFASSSLCFVTAHLAAGFPNYEERNKDYRTIAEGLRFQRDRSIDDHDSVIWLGDFNYRIGLNYDHVLQLIKIGDLETLYDNDQLQLQMGRGYAFSFYDEAKITFNPTYKYDIGTDTYDTSEKQRIPAWCDRVLRKGDNLKQTSYNAAPLLFSDHRPVYATFLCRINIVDEKKKEELSSGLYRQRKASVGNATANAPGEETEDEDLIGYEPIEPGLPPASSDRRKWWLDNGMPAQSTLRAPGNGYIPNGKRPSNPFTPSDEPDWIKVDRPAPPPSRTDSTRSIPTPRPPAARKVPPPFTSTDPLPRLPPRKAVVAVDGTDSHSSRSPSVSSVRSLPILSSNPATTPPAVLRKPAPPVPKKPSQLSATSPLTSQPPPNVLTKTPPPTVPPPRRSMAAAKTKSAAEEHPPLPPRRMANAPLMDGDGVDMEGLKDWEVLKPG